MTKLCETSVTMVRDCIAILDTGVDNEHFSLDDFSDDNDDNENDPKIFRPKVDCRL